MYKYQYTVTLRDGHEMVFSDCRESLCELQDSGCMSGPFVIFVEHSVETAIPTDDIRMIESERDAYEEDSE